jgi:hypothetical protein
MFLDIRELRLEKKNVLIVWSQICGKIAFLSKKFPLKNYLQIMDLIGVKFGCYTLCDAIYTWL